MVTQAGGVLVVLGIKGNIREVPKVLSDSVKLRWLANPGKHFLSRCAQQLHLLVLHEFVKGPGQAALRIGQMSRLPAQSERP